MSQANPANTTTCAPATTPAAPSPQRITARQLASDIRAAHADLIRRLQALPPYRFDPRLQASPEQLELQADTLRCNLLAMQQYVVALVRDTAYHTTTINTDRLYLDGLFSDIIGDLCGAITIAADKVREDGVYRGSAA
jgi:hypothetical protein